MLGHSAFYHNIIRKYIVAFGSLFNDIHVIRSQSDGTLAKDIKVPITFASKDKTRYQLNSIHSRQNEIVNVATILPKMSFILNNSIEYDNLRVLNPLLERQKRVNSDFTDTNIRVGKPFNFNFQLSIWTKYLDDMFQIIEQVLSFFNPDYHVTIREIPELNIETSIPIVFQGCSPNFETEFNDESWRVLRFDIDFVLKGWIYPPIKDNTLIENIKVNMYSDIDSDSKIAILKNEYDDINDLFYSAIVENNDSYFANVENGDSIQPISQITLNVYKSDTEPLLSEDEFAAYWLNESEGKKYYITKSGDDQNVIELE
jgi:hypothetical protein